MTNHDKFSLRKISHIIINKKWKREKLNINFIAEEEVTQRFFSVAIFMTLVCRFVSFIKMFLITFKLSCQNIHDENIFIKKNEKRDMSQEWVWMCSWEQLIISFPTSSSSLIHHLSCEMKINDSKWSGILASSRMLSCFLFSRCVGDYLVPIGILFLSLSLSHPCSPFDNNNILLCMCVWKSCVT